MKYLIDCGDCQYWKLDESSEGQKYGECRAKAPQPIQREGQGAWWPRTSYDDGCGEGES